MKITLVAGARPNFMKIAPLMHALRGSSIQYRLVHTGQHYDEKMSDSFFRDLNIPLPDANLEVGSGSHAVQTAKIMIEFEKELLANPCDYVLVVGDVNSTLACSIVAKKMNIKVIHVEAGLRSGDWTMPEEVNRVVTDALTDIYFTTTPEAGYHLVREGVSASKIHLVGNVMIDSLVANMSKLQKPALYDSWGLSPRSFYLLTLHRPSNVDDPAQLQSLVALLAEQAGDKTIVFPIHPRTQKNLNLDQLPGNIRLVDPMRYLEFIYLVRDAFAILTDSGGIQEESTYLQVPCLTLRENTERPETITVGSNELVGTQTAHILAAFERLRSGNWKKGQIPLLWDGKAAERMVQLLSKLPA